MGRRFESIHSVYVVDDEHRLHGAVSLMGARGSALAQRRGLTQVWQICRDRGLTVVIETPLPHLLGGQPQDFDWILSRVPREGTGVCIDTSHTSLGGTLFESVERYANRLVHLQVSDNRGTYDDHLPPGEGIIDWPFARSSESTTTGCSSSRSVASPT